jgi:hypothetical protein
MLFHLNLSRISRSKGRSASDAFAYLMRQGRHEGRDGQRVVASGSVGMPHWVRDSNGGDFWSSADRLNRRLNALMGYHVEVSLPRALSAERRQRALGALLERLGSISGIGRGHALPASWAIHDRDDGGHPHAHVLLSQQIHDGSQRPRSAWFSRANSSRPQNAGTPRADHVGKRQWLRDLRELWATVLNEVLAAAGLAARVDHRSRREQAAEVVGALSLEIGRHAQASADVSRLYTQPSANRSSTHSPGGDWRPGGSVTAATSSTRSHRQTELDRQAFERPIEHEPPVTGTHRPQWPLPMPRPSPYRTQTAGGRP